MPQYPAPPAEAKGSKTTRALPTGWIEEKDPISGQLYFVDQPILSDTLSLNPLATWDDPRLNPSLYPNHDPSLGVTVRHHQPTSTGNNKDNNTPSSTSSRLLLPSFPQPVPVPVVKDYPDYPIGRPSGGAAILTVAGAAIAAGMVHSRATGTTRP
ncbi:uncharacterized protein EI90DRAFT_3019419 [Cantharellus anzutake]|uniref:uncharacterized protein n=1 Tax=Cantharellus anzutake TaxID=1750568 RepID=UPI0019087FA0|nr:uncharacterized protein EI90DRAFT_3023038 [Cantharellus anzutake]XP_038911832.1 uncharacterized protein EI90DRAFT_3019419 [Cantharellus anzutake]KAF8312426.1 hypothetical protein EI90DRAFT_3023038 [Cantharellus anzutake]KAF8324796.1 hypothetical protein EI90DRAFT_3019419 [Cantharellus anzutake]